MGERPLAAPTSPETASASSAPEAPANSAPIASWDARWSESAAAASTPRRDRALAVLVEELARADPARALALAGAETNWRLRADLHDAALRGWAATKPDAAADHALAVAPAERRRAMAAVLAGAAENPAAAVKTALRVCAADPEPAGDYGHAAIAGLVEHGAYVEAVQFGQSVGSVKFPFLLKSAFYEWAQREPADALAAVATVEDPALREQARAEVFNGWARADSRALAEFALQQPAGPTRATALAEALPHWVEKDPEAAADWIERHDSGPEFDDGTAAVAGLQSVIRGHPELAMNLAGNLHDPAKRSHMLRVVFRQWAERDRAAAQRFLDGRAGGDRTLLAAELRDLFPDG